MSMYLRQLEYERKREKEFGQPALLRGVALGEHSQRLKRNNLIENRALRHKISLIKQEEACRRLSRKKEMDSIEKLQYSIQAPVSLPLDQAELRAFHSALGYRPKSGHIANTHALQPQPQEWSRYSSAGGGYPRKPTLLSPEALREKQRQTDTRRPRSVRQLRTSMGYTTVLPEDKDKT